jgi:polar amino acid transport system substrate-binding protein
MWLGFVGLIAAMLSGLGWAPALAQIGPSAPPAPGVAIPNFWDPRQRAERPAEGAVPAIRFLTTDDFPPFNFLNDRGQLTGFNVDLARAICAELAISCTIQVRAFDDLVGHLASKTADAVIAGIAITAANRETLDFSDPYLRLPARLLARRSEPVRDISAATLRGRTIAVAAGTAHEAYLTAMFPDVTAKPYPTADAARAAVKAGETDFAFGDGQQSAVWLQSAAAADCCRFAGGPYLDARFFGEGYAIAVAKGANTLKHALNAALHAVANKGVYADLYLRYFPVSFF